MRTATLIVYRPFRNEDPPAIAELWRRCAVGRWMFQPISTTLLDELVLSKPYFDRHGLILAFEKESNDLVGLVHAGFGPNEALTDIDTSSGVTNMILVHPNFRHQGVGSKLLELSEDYQKSRGAKVCYAGPVHPLSPFYLGLYGGSELPGFLQSTTGLAQFLEKKEYQLADSVVIYERELYQFRAKIDRSQMKIRRSCEFIINNDPCPTSWWDASQFGSFDRTHYLLREKRSKKEIGSAMTWYLEPFGLIWGVRAAGLTHLEIIDEMREQGYGTYFVGEIIKHLQNQGTALLSVQTMERNIAAHKLYEKLGIKQTDLGSIYRKK